MSSPKSLLAGGAGALFLAFSAIAAPQTRSVSGWVRTMEDAAVARVDVSVDQAGDYVTTDSGKFAVPLLPPLRPGFPVTFAVRNYVIVDPCVNERGRTYLPDPDFDTVHIKVVPKGDHRLLSGHSIGCLVEETQSQLEPKSRAAGGPRASLSRGSLLELAERREPLIPEKDAVPGRMVPIAFTSLTNVTEKTPSDSDIQEHRKNRSPAADEFVAKQAKEMGFTTQQLTAAIAEWTRSVEDPYEKGLAASYEGRYAEASRYISASIPSPPGPFVTRYVPLAHAEYEQGHYAAAESALRKVLAVHPDDPLVLNNLGIALKAQAKYADAEPLLRLALETDQKALGPGHPDVAGILGNLADLYRTEQRYADAQPLYEQALKIERKTLGPNDPDLATTLNGLALLHHAQRDDLGAMKLYAQAVAIDEKTTVSRRPQDAAITLSNLADLYRDNRMFDDAEPLYKRALDMVLKALGPDHPDTARIMNNWALLDHAEGQDQQAEPTYKMALAITRKSLGPEHPFVATILDNLGEVYRTQKRYSEAEPLYKQALGIAERTEPGSLETGTYLNHLAVLYHAQGQFAQAEPFYKQALVIGEKGMRPDDPQLAVALGNLGLIYKDERKYDEAEPLLKRALAINRRALEPDDPALAANLEVLALTLFGLKRPDEGKMYANQAQEILFSVQASQARENGDNAQAESLYKRALTSAEEALGARDPEVARVMSNLAVVLHTEGKDAEAEPLLKSALGIIEQNASGHGDMRVAILADNLAAVLHNLRRDAEAKTYEELAAKIRAKAKQEAGNTGNGGTPQ